MGETKTAHNPAQQVHAGLVHLKGLTNLEGLFLSFCEKITDAGLAHLKGMTNLQDLDLSFCRNITYSGVAELQKALPNCRFEH